MRGVIGDKRAASWMTLDDSLFAHRGSAYAELLREFTLGRHPVAVAQRAAQHFGFDLRDDLFVPS